MFVLSYVVTAKI